MDNQRVGKALCALRDYHVVEGPGIKDSETEYWSHQCIDCNVWLTPFDIWVLGDSGGEVNKNYDTGQTVRVMRDGEFTS